MTTGPATPRGTLAGYPYRPAPWTIAHGTGSQAERCAEGLRAECDHRGIDGEKMTIAEASSSPYLGHNAGLVVVAPSEERFHSDVEALLGPARDLVIGYRARRPDGMTAFRLGLVEGYRAGFVQVVAREKALAAATARLGGHVCARHALERSLDDPGVIFTIFEDSLADAVEPRDVLQTPAEILAIWDGIRRWGLLRLDDVEVLTRQIELLRRVLRRERRGPDPGGDPPAPRGGRPRAR